MPDAATGGWKRLTPEARSDDSYNSAWSREMRDQTLVTDLEERGYRCLVNDLLKHRTGDL